MPHQDTARLLLGLYKQIKEKFSIELPDLNLGGGLGIKYQETDDPPQIENWVNSVVSAVQEQCSSLGIQTPRIMVEPGRSIVASAGLTIYRIGNIKDIEGIRKYIAVDGGMTDNVRPIMYGARYTAEINGKVNSKDTELVTIAGKHCESGDILIKDISLPKANQGDVLAVYATGAYNYSMASNYNRITKPAMVLVKEAKSRVIIERETLSDLCRLDRLPEDL